MLLDEPISGLDPETTLIVEDLLKQRAADGAAVIFVTHDSDQANRPATRKLILQNEGLT
jgi:ABC-type multidrug transport system ATPase subunit